MSFKPEANEILLYIIFLELANGVVNKFLCLRQHLMPKFTELGVLIIVDVLHSAAQNDRIAAADKLTTKSVCPNEIKSVSIAYNFVRFSSSLKHCLISVMKSLVCGI